MSGGKVQHIRKLLALAESAAGAEPVYFTPQELAEAIDAVGIDKREKEIGQVARFWPKQTLELALYCGADWHALVEPARWADVELPSALSFGLKMTSERMRWPRTDEWRVRFGREHGHKKPAAPGQESLL